MLATRSAVGVKGRLSSGEPGSMRAALELGADGAVGPVAAEDEDDDDDKEAATKIELGRGPACAPGGARSEHPRANTTTLVIRGARIRLPRLALLAQNSARR